MMYYTFLKYKKREIHNQEYLFWTVVWVLFLIVALFPNWLDPLVETLEFARTFDLLVTAGFLFITGIMFHTYATVRKNEEQIEKIVRRIAMKKK